MPVIDVEYNGAHYKVSYSVNYLIYSPAEDGCVNPSARLGHNYEPSVQLIFIENEHGAKLETVYQPLRVAAMNAIYAAESNI